MKRIRTWWKSRTDTAKIRLLVLTVLIVGAVIPTVWALARTGDFESAALNLGTEMGGAVVTFVLIDLILASRDKQESEQQKAQEEKADLIAHMGSEVREVAIAAADELRRIGWLKDGSTAYAVLRRADLSGADLTGAMLEGANLHRAILKGADLWQATLRHADLSGAWLHEARLWDANLEGANLWQARIHGTDLRRANLREALLNGTRLQGADLRQAKLEGANLTGARLQEAKLQGASLRDADLEGALLDEAEFDAQTILPDGSAWTPDIDLTRFTNPDHPECFRPPFRRVSERG
jgi:hypothetical protein